MARNLYEIRKHVEDYLKEYLPHYHVLEIRKKSRHPEDAHLYMVSAKKSDGTYAVWTCWNELTQVLNHGHYNLSSIEDCEAILDEFDYT